jgi:hypothetical protein
MRIHDRSTTNAMLGWFGQEVWWERWWLARPG